MKTINLLKTGLLFGAMIATPAVMANSTYVNSDAYSYSSGATAGEFNVTGQAATVFDQYYNQSSSVNVIIGGGFETFCLETGVNIALGNTHPYTYGLSQTTAGSGTGAGLALSAGAAWLYEQFAVGTLSGYDYANSQSGNYSRNYEAGQLQAAIWYFQGGQTLSGWPSATSSNPFYNDAIAKFGTLTAADAAENNAYDVSVLVLTNSSCQIVQNQLVLTGTPTNNVSTPDNGASALLLGLGLASLTAAGVCRKVAIVRA